MTARTRTLNAGQRLAIARALEMAAKQYGEDAELSRENDRLSRQFTMQRDMASELAGWFEWASAATVTEGE